MNVAGSSSAAIQYPYAEHKTDSTLVNGTKEFYVLSSPAATSPPRPRSAPPRPATDQCPPPRAPHLWGREK